MPLLSIVLASRLGVVAGDCRATLRKGHDMQPYNTAKCTEYSANGSVFVARSPEVLIETV